MSQMKKDGGGVCVKEPAPTVDLSAKVGILTSGTGAIALESLAVVDDLGFAGERFVGEAGGESAVTLGEDVVEADCGLREGGRSGSGNGRGW